MAVYLISFDFKNASDHDYAELHDTIRSFGDAIHILDTTYLVDAFTMDVKGMSEKISKVHHPESHFIVELKQGSHYWAKLSSKYQEWITSRF